MTRIHSAGRALIYLIATLAVICIAIYIVLFALGLKIDWDNRKVDQTGMIYLKSNPVQALIKLDNKKIAETTPARLRWMQKGKYQLSICKKKYYCWSKQISVEPGLVTEEKSVRLFYKSPTLTKVIKGKNIVVLDNKKSGYVFDNKKITFFSVEPERKKVIKKLNYRVNQVQTSPLKTRAIINNNRIINLLNGKQYFQFNKQFPNDKLLIFNPVEENSVIAIRKGKLVKINIRTLEKELILNPKGKRYYYDQAGIWQIVKPEKDYILRRYNWNGKLINSFKKTIPVAGLDKSKIAIKRLTIKKVEDQILLEDNKQRTFELRRKKLRYLVDNLTSLQLSHTNQRYFTAVSGGDELWLKRKPIKVDRKEKFVVLRYNQTVSEPDYLGFGYLAFLKRDKLMITDYTGDNIVDLLPKYRVKKYWIVDHDRIMTQNYRNELIIFRIAN